MPKLFGIVVKIAGTILLLAVTVYFVRAFDARRMPDLGAEYRIEFESEFSSDQEAETDWPRYLAIEAALAAELEEKIDSDERFESLLDRYSEDSLTYPLRFDGNWNRSYELTTPSPRGVAIMLHGLSDSPYSMLHTAQLLAGAGYNVIVPRMPGHGFAVGGLLEVQWEDWTAALRVAIRRGMELPGGDQSLLLVGYSNGGLLAVDYALRCGDDDELPCPDRLVLLSPAIAISPLAFVTSLHAAVSWLPYFEKFKWLSILPEIDPFKFTSFPKKSAWEIYQYSRRIHKLLADPSRVDRLPPILTFQSVVDNTVSSSAVIDTLYDRLPANGGELIVYDVNRNNTIVHLMRKLPDDPRDYFRSGAPLNYGVTILRNRDAYGLEVDAATMPAGSESFRNEATDLLWPLGIYSLSHIAVPFPPSDKIYGDGNLMDDDDPGVVLGALAPRGELGVLMLSSDFFLRTRHNPFYRYQSDYMIGWLARD